MRHPITLIEAPAGVRPVAPDTLADVFHTSHRRLVVQLYGVTGDAAAAEDLVGEAFVRAWAAGNALLAVPDPEAWVRSIALVRHRHRWRMTRLEPADLPDLGTHLAVVEALRRLPDRQREVVALHHLADLDAVSIADALRITEHTVRSRLARGHAAMDPMLLAPDLLAAFAERARDHVAVPEFSGIEQRGRQFRRRRRVLLAALLAAVVGLGGWLSSVEVGDRQEPPPDENGLQIDARRWPRDGGLAPGRYELLLFDEYDAPTALVVVPDGWRAGAGPFQAVPHRPDRARAMVFVDGLSAVSDEPCNDMWFGMREVGDDPGQVLAAVLSIPRFHVVQAPSPDDRFGFPGTHVRLRVGDTTCPGGAPYWMWRTSFQLTRAPEPGSLSDVWVVDLGERVAVVTATWLPGIPERTSQELARVVESLTFLSPVD